MDYIKNPLKKWKVILKQFKEKCKQLELIHDCCDTCALKSQCGGENCLTSQQPRANREELALLIKKRAIMTSPHFKCGNSCPVCLWNK